jgi:hypothetical protein
MRPGLRLWDDEMVRYFSLGRTEYYFPNMHVADESQRGLTAQCRINEWMAGGHMLWTATFIADGMKGGCSGCEVMAQRPFLDGKVPCWYVRAYEGHQWQTDVATQLRRRVVAPC